MRFESPYFLILALFFLVLTPWLFKSNRFLKRNFVLSIKSKSRFRLDDFSFIFFSIGLILLMIGLARPQSISRSQERKADGIDIVMVMDVSLSMLIEDMGEKNRMETAKSTFESFIQGRLSDRIGFVIFSGEPLTLAPPTLDYGLLLAQLKQVQPGKEGLKDGTAIGDGLALAINRLKKSSAKSRVIILLTDGDNNVGRIDPITAGELAQGYDIKVYSIAIGTEGRVRQPLPQQTAAGTVYTYVWVENQLNTTLLKQISEKTGGLFFRVTEESALYRVFEKINQLEKTDFKTQDKIRYDDHFSLFLILGSVFVLTSILFRVFYARQWL